MKTEVNEVGNTKLKNEKSERKMKAQAERVRESVC